MTSKRDEFLAAGEM